MKPKKQENPYAQPPGFKDVNIECAGGFPPDFKMYFHEKYDPVHFFPPMVAAKVDKNGDLNAQAIFFVKVPKNLETKEGPLPISFYVYIRETWRGTYFQPEFLIQFAITEDAEELTEYYRGYSLEFKVSEKYLPVEPLSIVTYLWNQDPEGSRGTETTVQSSTGGG